MDFKSVISGFLELALLGGAAIYAGLVLTSYLTDGLHRRPQVDWRDPALSAGRVAVWLGVHAFALAVRLGKYFLGILSEASAEVGEWFLSHRNHAN